MEKQLMFPGKYKWGDIDRSELVTITLPSGKQIEYVKAGDMVFPKHVANTGFIPDQRLNNKKVREMETRDDDVLVCAYPKCGTHWVWEITQMLVRRKAEYSPYPKESAMLEFHLPEEFDDMPSPRVFNSHYSYRDIPKGMIDKKCKILYVLRNPKDAAVSLWYHFKNIHGENFDVEWNDFLYIYHHTAVEFSNYFDYVLDWEKFVDSNRHNILLLFYEDIKENPNSKIEEMAKFLGVNIDKAMISEIADKVNFQKMKEAKIEHRSEQYKNTPAQDRMVSLTKRLYRKGQVGDWKNYFTVAQNEQLDDLIHNKMKESHLKFTYVAPNGDN